MADYPSHNQPRTLADRTFVRLQEEIVRGVIPPGSKISEVVLAKRYGVSRGPIREVIRRLTSSKLLVHEVHVGARVASLDAEMLVNLYYMREALEGMAARLAAETMSDQEIAKLHELLEQHEQQQELRQNVAYFQPEEGLDFHYRIIQGSRNPALINALVGELYHLLRMSRYQFSAMSSRPLIAFKEHRHIVEAIDARDSELAEILMRRHIRRSRQNIEAQAERGLQRPTTRTASISR